MRSVIIGVKKANERLRFYADKTGIMKFAQIEVEAIDLSSAYASDLSKYYHYTMTFQIEWDVNEEKNFAQAFGCFSSCKSMRNNQKSGGG